jgi:hypothetical protein
VVVVIVVVSIVLLQLAIWVPVLMWLRRRSARLQAALPSNVLQPGERVAHGPEPGVYRGGSGAQPKVKGNGVLALTDRRLLFIGLVQKDVRPKIDVSLGEITAVRDEAWFRRSRSGRRTHLVLTLSSGDEIGFFVRDNAAWTAALRHAIAALTAG